jgi:hypothetical protein
MKRASSVSGWAFSIVLGLGLTAAFVLALPTRDRNARIEIPLPYVPERQESVAQLDPPPPPVAPLGSGLYKWRAAAGRVHYGDRPPEGVHAEAVDADATKVSVVTMTHPLARTVRPPSAPVTRAPRQTLQEPTNPQKTPTCDEIKRRIARIDARMRHGYKAREGERLRDRRRELVALRSTHCHGWR